jgi:hypothetical protein
MRDEELKIEELKIIRIGGPGLSDKVYGFPKSPLGRQAPLPSAMRVLEQGSKPVFKVPQTGIGVPYIVNPQKLRG